MPYTLPRSLLTVIIPGIIATFPWLLVIAKSKVPIDFPSNPFLVSGIAFAVVTITGAIFEGIGSIVEVRWDKRLERAYMVSSNWYIYLASAPDPQPVGYDYLARLVTSLYFELAMMLAAPSLIIGIGTVAWQVYPQYALQIVPGVVLLVAFAYAYFEYQARSTHEVLCKTRLELNRRIKK